MEPAASIIERLGGEAKVSEITGRGVTAPYKWQYPVERGGTGGLIPQRLHRVLLDHASSKGIPLSPADFLPVQDDPSGPVSGPACGLEPVAADPS